MADINIKDGTGSITIGANDWLSGLTSMVDPTRSTVIDYPIADMIDINPMENLGCLTPSRKFSSTGITNASSVVENIYAWERDGDDVYIMGEGSAGAANFYKYTGASETISTTSPFIHSNPDVDYPDEGNAVKYKIGDDNIIMFTHRDGSVGNGDFTVYNITDDTFTDDWIDDVLTHTQLSDGGQFAPFPVIVGADDIAYIGDGNKVHSFDGGTGVNGTLSTDVLTLPKGQYVRDFVKTGESLMIFTSSWNGRSIAGGNYEKSSSVYFWDYLSSDPFKVISIGGGIVVRAHEYSGTVIVFTTGEKLSLKNTHSGTIQIWDGQRFKVVRYIEFIPRYYGSSFVEDEMLYWSGEGNIYAFGKPFPGMSQGYFCISSGTGDDDSALFSVENELYTGGTTVGTYLQREDSTTTPDRSNAGSITTCPISLPYDGDSVAKITDVVLILNNGATTTTDIDVTLTTDSFSNKLVIDNFGSETTPTDGTVSFLSKRVYRTNDGDELPLAKNVTIKIDYVGSVNDDPIIIDKIIVNFEIINIT